MAKLTTKKLVELLEQGQHLYVVCVSSEYIRDAQYYQAPFLIHDEERALDEERDEEDLAHEEENWVDYENPRDFLGTVMAANPLEAIQKIAKRCGYDCNHLEAYDALPDEEWR